MSEVSTQSSISQLLKRKYMLYAMTVLGVFILSNIMHFVSSFNQFTDSVEEDAKLMAVQLNTAVSFEDRDFMGEFFAQYDFPENILSVNVYSSKGKVLFEKGEKKQKYNTQKDIVTTFDYVTINKNISLNKEVIGSIQVVFNTYRVKNLLYYDFIAFAIFLFGLFGISYYSIRNVTTVIAEPINNLSNAISEYDDQVSKSNQIFQIPIDKQIQIQEIYNLMVVFNELLINLDSSNKELRDSEEKLKNVNEYLEKMVDQRTKELDKKINELEEYQNRMVLQEKLASLGTLSAGIAHEIKNPIHLIVNSVQMIQEVITSELVPMIDETVINTGLPDYINAIGNLKKACSIIESNGTRADSIISNMLKQSRSSTYDLSEVKFDEFITEYFNLAYHSMRAKYQDDINYKLELDDIGSIKIPAEDIGRCLTNFFDNAFYALHDRLAMKEDEYRPELIVGLKKDNQDNCVIEIRDNGVGIPSDVLDKIMEPFFTTKPPGEGTGLGLSIVNDIITSQGGQLNLSSKPMDFTLVEIVLPLKE